jgi:hypothetical protein
MIYPQQEALVLAWFWGPDDDIDALFDELLRMDNARTGKRATQEVIDDLVRLIDATMNTLPLTDLNRWRALQWWDMTDSVQSWRLMMTVHWPRLKPDMKQLVSWRIEKHQGQSWMHAMIWERQSLFGM